MPTQHLNSPFAWDSLAERFQDFHFDDAQPPATLQDAFFAGALTISIALACAPSEEIALDRATAIQDELLAYFNTND